MICPVSSFRFTGLCFLLLCIASTVYSSQHCVVTPLGSGIDDTDQVENAINKCGRNGSIVLNSGSFNITRKMTWDLVSSRVDLYGYLNFNPDIQYWLNPNNTDRVVFIQSQASWFVLTGSDFEIDAHNAGGIVGNGQPWWTYFQSHTKADGDGRPIALTVWKATRAVIRNFVINSPPFWCNTVAESSHILYDGMVCNATNSDPAFFGLNVVPNTDGINTYRSSHVTLLNWDVTCGDDCLAIKGNSSDILAQNITCRGGNGIAFGSLGQYANLSDIVENVVMEDILITRIDPNIQPNMQNGIYFKTWTGTANGSPPTGGGGGAGMVQNVTTRNVVLDRVNLPIHLYQTNGGHSTDKPSSLRFSNLAFANWTGTATGSTIVNFACSPLFGCDGISFGEFDVAGPNGGVPRYICQNVADLSGLGAPCTASGTA